MKPMTTRSLCLLILIGTTSICMGQVPAEKVDAADMRRRVMELAEQLSVAKFQIRNSAMMDLWQLGLPAQPHLIELSQHEDPEIRGRVRMVLRDFSYGVTPEAPIALRRMITRFRDGSSLERQAAFSELLRFKHYDTIEHLIGLESDDQTKRTLLGQLFSDANVIEDFIQFDRISSLIDRVGAEQDEDWRREMCATVLFSPKMIQRLAKAKKLESLTQFLDKESIPGFRRYFMMTFTGNPQTMLVLAEQDQFDYAHKLIGMAMNQEERTELVTRMMASPRVAEVLIKKGRFLAFLDAIDGQIDLPVHYQILINTMRNRQSVAALLSREGIDGLVAIADRVTDEVQRGELLGAMVSSSSFVAYLRQENEVARIVEIAQHQDSSIVQEVYIQGILSTDVLKSLPEMEVKGLIHGILEITNASKNESFRQQAIADLVTIPAFIETIDNPEAAATALQTIEKLPPEKIHRTVASLVLVSDSFRMFFKHGLMVDFIRLTCKCNDQARDQTLYRMLSHSDSFRGIPEEDRNGELLAAIKELESTNRWAFVKALLRSRLIQASRDTKLLRLVLSYAQTLDDPGETSNALRAVVSNSRAVSLLTKPDDMDWIVRSMPTTTPDVTYELINRISSYSIQRKAYIEAGHLNLILRELKRIEPARRSVLLQRLLSSRDVATFLLGRNEISQLIEIVQSQESVLPKLEALKGVLANYAAMPSLLDEGQFDVIVKLIRCEQDPHRQASLWGDFIVSSGVAEHIVKEKRTELILQFLDDGVSVSSRQGFLVKMFRSPVAVQAIADAGRFDSLLDIVRNDKDPLRQSTLISAMLTSNTMLQRLVDINQLLPLFDLVMQVDKKQLTFVGSLYRHPGAVTAFVEADRFDDLIALAESDSNPYQRLSLLKSLFGSAPILRELARSEKWPLLYQIVRREPESRIREQLLVSLVRYSPTLKIVIEVGEFETLIDVIQEQPQEQRGRLLDSLFSHEDGVRELLDAEREDLLFDFLDSRSDVSRRNSINRLMASRNTRALLIDAGHLPRLVRWAKSAHDAKTVQQRRQWLNDSVGDAMMKELFGE